jgi:hypothetical protein
MNGISSPLAENFLEEMQAWQTITINPAYVFIVTMMKIITKSVALIIPLRAKMMNIDILMISNVRGISGVHKC